ncbi:MAG: terminase [Ornithinimicrobium sp.]
MTRPPTGLKPPGRALWDAVVGPFALADHELVLLGSAARLADLIGDLEETLTADGLVVSGSTGQPRLNGAVAELRQARLTLSRLVADLGLPMDEAAGDVVLTSPASRRASRAAHIRHDRDRARAVRSL